MNRKLFLITNLFLIVVLLFPSQIVAASNRNFTINRISKAWDGSQLKNGSYGPVISSDGRFVVYYSLDTNIIKGGLPTEPYPNNKLYLFDQKTGKTELVSVTSDGTPDDGNDGSPAISADG